MAGDVRKLAGTGGGRGGESRHAMPTIDDGLDNGLDHAAEAGA